MQISISCPNCGWAIFGAAATKVDSSTSDLQCTRCKTIVRITATMIHEGKPHDESSYWYTYDETGNKIPYRRVHLRSAVVEDDNAGK